MPPKKQHWTFLAQHLVLSPHTSELGTLFGGTLLSWVDEAASLFSRETMGTPRVVTASIEKMDFLLPAPLGKTVRIYGKLLKPGRTSITIAVRAALKTYDSTPERDLLTTTMVWVSIDLHGKPIPWRK